MTPPDANRPPIEADCHLPDPPHSVWRALTSPDLLSQWLLPMARGNKTDERADGGPGADFSLDGSECGLSQRIDCTVLDSDPPHFLRIGWAEWEGDAARLSEVSFHLARTAAGGTHLRVIHGLPVTFAPRASAFRAANLNIAATTARAA